MVHYHSCKRRMRARGVESGSIRESYPIGTRGEWNVVDCEPRRVCTYESGRVAVESVAFIGDEGQE